MPERRAPRSWRRLRRRRRATEDSATSSRPTVCCSSSRAGRARTSHSRTCISITSSHSAPRTGTSSTSAWSSRRFVTRAERKRRAHRGIRATCPMAKPGWPSLEPIGTIRQPSGSVRFGNGTMSWYPRQCVGARCGRDQKLVPSRARVLDHVAFSVENFDALYAKLRREGVKVLEPPHPFGDGAAFIDRGSRRPRHRVGRGEAVRGEARFSGHRNTRITRRRCDENQGEDPASRWRVAIPSRFFAERTSVKCVTWLLVANSPSNAAD